MGIDLFPTLLDLAGLPLPQDRVIDGVSLVDHLALGLPLDREAIYFHQLGVLRAVRGGRFKYHDRHRVLFGNPTDWPLAPMLLRGPWLFDLELDPGESFDVSDRYPEEAKRLGELLEKRRQEAGDNPRGWR